MESVSNVTSFDKSLKNYVSSSYVTSKYVDTLGCTGLNQSVLNDYYAQYTVSVLCSSIIQSSIDDCGLSSDQSDPICADTCALMATSEEEIIVNSNLCSSHASNYMSQIRSDFTICASPADSLTGSCVEGATNEPDNCGFANNTIGLCTYCDSESDSCCTKANATTVCENVTIPSSTASIQPVVTSSSTAGSNASNGSSGLSKGAIAGIVIGSVAGAAILAALIFLLFICRRRRRRSQTDAVSLNQPNPQRKGATPPMQQAESPTAAAFNVVPGGRVARMSALREMPSSSPAQSRTSGAMFAAKYSDTSDSEGMGASPGAMSKRIPPVTGKRHGSLSSSSALAGLDSDSSPRSGTIGQYSSPEAVTSGQSEQLSYFRDYYSQDDIQPGDHVAVLWAYSPRAGDEFELDRGEMLKVIGIWDDGWATGVRVHERAEDYDIRHREQRDSGVSHGSKRPGSSPAPSGEIKAFPLVCICLPQHWRTIIDGGVPEEEDEY
ncbi:uncharacterized protein N7483_010211 [Penicillium malachiteum]|uniref:uncharacterized protein n=1 Tax=Penicillium malachiteum TaxID=1324776 RepID=UPI0025470909|nr:uncharacterized protein N7483_010211 [Penicillium malachiteum]KAJ5713030.1 hypothetical protein N7483_010211 [Penicillium malachiteum]